MDEITPTQITQWLKEIGKDRAWLAQQTQQSMSTVNGWLAKNRPRKINAHAQRAIRDLMDRPVTLEPKLSMSLWGRAQADADAEGISIDEWMERAVKAALKISMLTVAACTLFHMAQGQDAVTAAMMGLVDTVTLAGNAALLLGSIGVEIVGTLLS